MLIRALIVTGFRAVDGRLGRPLAAIGGKVGETARLAGVDPRSLYSKMRRYGLR